MAENLLKIKSISNGNQDKLTDSRDHFVVSHSGTQNRYEYNVREFQAISAPAFGATHSVKIPAHNKILGEIWLDFVLPTLDAGSYCDNIAANLVKRLRLKCGSTFLDVEPRHFYTVALAKVTNQQRRRECIRQLQAQAGDECRVVIITPWGNLQRGYPRQRQKQNPGFDSSRLASDLVVEIELAALLEVTNSASSATQAFAPCVCRFEELIVSEQEEAALKARLPRQWVCTDLTVQEGLESNQSSTAQYDLDALISSAPTKNLWCQVRTGAQVTAKKFQESKGECSIKLTLDGREVYDESASVRERKHFNRGAPVDVLEDGNDLRGYSFCQEPYQFSSSGTFPNNEINHSTLDVSNTAEDDCEINLIAEHERVCRITSSGAIRISNE